MLTTTKNDTNDDVILHIIVLMLVLITVLYRNLLCLFSRNASNVTPVQAQQDIGLINTTGSKPLMVVPQKQSSSTTSAKNMVGQKKEDGGTKKVSHTKRTASFQRSNVSKDSLNSLKTSNSTTNHLLMTVEVSPPFMPLLAKDMHDTIPQSGLVIARR